MKIRLVFLLLLFGHFSAEAQKTKSYTAIDSIALEIPKPLTYSATDIAGYINTHFDNKPDKLRAIFTWLATNIHYDFSDQRTIMRADELDNYISQTLRQRKGKCQAYAETFHRLCQKTGIESQVVGGIVIPENDLPPASHAWIAAKTNNTWKLYDPTYAAGYLMEDRYYKTLDYDFYAAKAEVLIRSHYPFDPIWQLLTKPITLNAFLKPGKSFNNHDRGFFDYADSIQNFLALDEKSQMLESRRRIIAYGAPNEILQQHLTSLDQQIAIYEHNYNTDIFNQGVAIYNQVVEQYNLLIKNPSPNKLNESKKQKLIAQIGILREQLKSIKADLLKIDSNDDNFAKSIRQLKLATDKMLQDISRYEEKID